MKPPALTLVRRADAAVFPAQPVCDLFGDLARRQARSAVQQRWVGQRAQHVVQRVVIGIGLKAGGDFVYGV